MIPEQAIDAAAEVLSSQILNCPLNDNNPQTREAFREDAAHIVLAALPHIRKQIANEIRSMKMVGNTPHLHLQYNGALEIAARIVEEGTTK